MRLESLQNQLIDYCKTGNWDESKVPKPSRLYLYRKMVQHNVNSLLGKNFPLVRKSIEEEAWQHFTTAFLENYNYMESRFLEMPKALIAFEMAAEWGTKQGLPWLGELLEFEWTQQTLFNKVNSEVIAIKNFSGDLSLPMQLHPDWELLQLSYPFYRKEWQQAPGQYFLLLYRDKNSLEVENLELNPFLAAFWLALAESPKVPVMDILSQLLQQYQIDLNEGVLAACQGFLGDMGGRGLLALQEP